MATTSAGRRTRSLDGGVVAGATVVMNVSTYGFTILAARLLGPREYGELVACLGLLLVVQVAAYGLQTAAARRIAVDRVHVAAIERAVLALAAKVSLGLGLVLLVATPVTVRLLHLGGPGPAVLVAVAAVPLTFAGAQAGVLQGEKRWGALAVFYVASGVPRLVIGTAIVLGRPDATTAFLGVVVGLLFPVLVGWWVLRGREAAPGAAAGHHGRAILVEGAHNAQALLAFSALSGVDIILARQVLDEHDAGLYAAGLIMAKVMMFLPQFVVVVAFPDMATREGRRRALLGSLLAVGSLGLVAALSAKLLSGLAMVFVGGAEFGEVEGVLWIFAVLGTVVTLVQLQVYALLAQQGRRTVLVVWGALVAAVVLGLRADSVTALVTTMVAVDTVLLAALTAVSLRSLRQPVAAPAPVAA